MKQIFIISGLSGAGKSSALGFFEDTGFFCMDNVPPRILTDVISLVMQSGIDKATMVVDARSEVFGDSIEKIRELKSVYEDIIKIIFLEASEKSIYERYALTRRNHPLGMNIEEAVKKEREILAPIREEADVIIDTTNLSPRQLRDKLRKVLEESYGEEFVFTYRLQSFGFKYGAPLDSDFIFDVRFFPNPYYIPELSKKTGLDKEVREYLGKYKDIKAYVDDVVDILQIAKSWYLKEGRTGISVAVGCSGGRHRSVYVVEEIGRKLQSLGEKVVVEHRDIKRQA